ncbi:hypothetical protein ACHAW6_003032 [Cyclotella cf. meneghiniana]
MDTCVYEVHFPLSHTEELTTNTIAEALYAQCDSDGFQYVMFDTIVGYKKNPNVAISWNNQVKTVNGCSTSWQKLSDLKESHPLQVAEFTLAMGMANEPAFNWWVTWVLKKRDQINSLVECQSTRYHKQTHKFGGELPKTVDKANLIDMATGTTFWHDAIELQIKMCGLLLMLSWMVSRCHQIICTKNVTLSLTSRWKIFVARPSL